MKTKKKLWVKAMMISSIFIFSAFALSSCDKDDDDNGGDNQVYTISGNASGTQMVPSVTGSGTGTISGTYNQNTRVMTYTSNWTNLSGAPTSASFYSGATGESGTAIGTPWSLGTGLTGTGSVSGTMTLNSDQATQLTNGNLYYSYGTSMNPSGEVRGQITATQQ